MNERGSAYDHSGRVVGGGGGGGDASTEHQEPATASGAGPNETDVERRKREPGAGTRAGQQPYGPKSHDNTSTNQTG
jgi:hypothetical protein